MCPQDIRKNVKLITFRSCNQQVLHAVNLRTRLDPPLSEHYFGNISRLAIAITSVEDREKEGYGVLNKVREAIQGVNGDYLATLREGDEHLKFMKERAAQTNKGGLVTFNFTSLCRFPLYEADFGWGRPVWVGSASLQESCYFYGHKIR